MDKELYITLITAFIGLIAALVGLYTVLVKNGIIKKIFIRKYYSSSKSNRGLDIIRAFKTKQNNEISIGYIKTEKDLNDLSLLDHEYYGISNISYSKLYEWWANDKKAISIVYNNDILYGAFGIFPVTKKWINQFYNGRIGESSLDSTTIKRAMSQECSDWYISGIVVRKTRQRPFIVIRLLKEASICWILNSKLNYPINLWAAAFSEDGENLLRKFDFQLERTKKQMFDNFPLYKKTFQKEELELFLRKI